MNSRGPRPILAVLLAAALLLTAVAWLRGAEYDEQYTPFLTGPGRARPGLSASSLPARCGDLQAARTSAGAIARDLRRTDVHTAAIFLGGGSMAPAGRQFGCSRHEWRRCCSAS